MPNIICACGRSNPKGVRCPCKASRDAAYEAARGTATQRGYGHRWHIESQAWLKALGAPLCACGCGRQANMVDHRTPHKGNMTLFWDKTNWQPYHTSCNTRKANRSEGGWGNVRR